MLLEPVRGPAALERAKVIAEELRLLLRRRDQLSLQAARLAGELERLDFGESMGSVSTIDWIRHKCYLGQQAAADLVSVGLTMEGLSDSVAAVEEEEIAGTEPAAGRHGPLLGRPSP